MRAVMTITDLYRLGTNIFRLKMKPDTTWELYRPSYLKSYLFENIQLIQGHAGASGNR